MIDQQTLVLGLVFALVFGTIAGIGLLSGRDRTLRDRLKGVGSGSGGMTATDPAESRWRAMVTRFVAPVAKLGTPSDDQRISALREKFLHAGIREPSAPSLFLASRLALAFLLPGIGWILMRVAGLYLPQQVELGVLVLLAGVGFSLPMLLLSTLAKHRQREVLEAFPDALDLIIVCVEAGLGLDMAINKTAEEMKLRSPALARELELVGIELRVGSSRERALRNLALRTGLEEVSSFASMLVQTDKYGASLADALRVHGDLLRTRRRLKAEEAAAKIPMKLLFPLMFFIFPSLMLVLLGPAFIQISRNL